MLPKLANTIETICNTHVPEARKKVLQPLIDYIQEKLNAGKESKLNFICTHNSRRSQFSQIWAQTAADYYGVPVRCFSGGVEVTNFNERAVKAIESSGFKVSAEGDGNPTYSILPSNDSKPILAFSKLYDDPTNPEDQFAAVMTCAHADENCPFIPGAEKRLAVRYEDPKEFDNTPKEAEMYKERSMQIGREMFYTFGQIKR